MDEQRAKLMATARAYAVQRAREPGVVGVLLYGSLAAPEEAGALTPLSDVDVAVFLDDGAPLPTHFSEHRLFDGVKVDVLPFPIQTLRGLVTDPPTQLWERGWLVHFVIKTLLLGSPEAILYDPTDEIARVREAFRAHTTYGALALPDTRRWLNDFGQESLKVAHTALASGNPVEAHRHASAALWTLTAIPTTLTGNKRLSVAAEQMGIPGFATQAAALRSLNAPSGNCLSAYRDAAQALSEYIFHHLFTPISDDLRRDGMTDPIPLELRGDHALFWPGDRIHEWGRLIDELALSFVWSRFEEERGDLLAAQNVLWAVGVDRTERRCRGLIEALKEQGHDASPHRTALLTDPEFARLSDTVNAQAIPNASPSSGDARRAVSCAEEMYRLLVPLLKNPETTRPSLRRNLSSIFMLFH